MFRPISLLAATLITLAALAPLAQVHATTQTITINQSHTFDGITVTVTGSITIDTTAKTITGSITVKAV
ncbi:MAG TPA: hypothetical protein VFE96_02310, partial [Candidatus Bathyarchaeia archaeon]|nr:hypothetical protein [Candidatus Bathyarchaeia archaeon]